MAGRLMKRVLGILRLIAFAVVAGIGTLMLFGLGLISRDHRKVFFLYSGITRTIRGVLNIRVRLHGEVPRQQGVLMSNHRSYIDIVLIPSKVPYVIVAKKQVKAWPIIGQAAVAIRTIFVDRDSAESRRKTRESIKQRLESGLSVLIYPEGTTFEGPGILAFKPGIFRHCADAGFSVIPVAIEFEDKAMAWIGADTFLPHFIEAFSRWSVRVHVSIGPEMKGSDGEELRRQAQQWVDVETRRLAAL